MKTEPSEATASQNCNVISFSLDGRTYAFPLETVVQIIPMVRLIPLREAPPVVAGIMNFRGRPVPIIYLRRYLGMPDRPPALHTPILLLSCKWPEQERTLGLIVDEVQDVVDLVDTQIVTLAEMLPPTLSHIPMLQGLAHTPEGTLVLLNLEQLFTLGPLDSTSLQLPAEGGAPSESPESPGG